MTGIPLQIAEPAGTCVRELRRFQYTEIGECPAGGYHDATREIGEIDAASRIRAAGDDWPHSDTRWPRTCTGCGRSFTEADQWQRNDHPVYRLLSGETFTMRRSLGMCAPPGTMIRAWWYDEHAGQPGESWLIALPDGGDWITTQPASGGGYWTVTGIAPAITVTPSIWHNAPDGWHGWIRQGVLEDA